jgi:GTPase SAR1 family protein
MSKEIDHEIDYKIAIAGLNNAGKTSIIKSLVREFDVILSLKPTKGVERNTFEFLGRKLYFWDFGGQEKYRAKYLNSPDHFFDGFKYVFYIMDVQDESSLDVNILYFKLAIKEFNTYSTHAKYILLFHKSDPNVDKKLVAKIKQEFFERVSPFLDSEGISIMIYETSIYEPFGIISAFSQPFLEDEELYENLSNVLKSFCEENDLGFSIIFTNDFFEMGHFKRDNIPTEEFKELLTFFFKNIKPDMKEEYLRLHNANYELLIVKFIIRFGKNELKFFTTVGFTKQKKKMEIQDLEEMVLKLNNNLQKILVNTDLTDYIQKK